MSSHTEVNGTLSGAVVDGRPRVDELLADLERARAETEKDPTPEQKIAGNYRKGRFILRGLHIAIENPKGSLRTGVSRGGERWDNTMTADYGYITRGSLPEAPKGRDGDPIDVFVGPDLDSDLVVGIDQQVAGRYDETKFVLCCDTPQKAAELYLSNYNPGWKIGPTAVIDLPGLLAWLAEGDHRSPFVPQMA